MRLEHLYEDFVLMDEAKQLQFIQDYRVRRQSDLSSVVKSSRVTSKIGITEEERVIMKVLGLKMKDIVALRKANIVEEPEDNGGDLFNEAILEEEEI